MKFLHCSDLHLGKRLNQFDLLEDQIAVLQQILEIARREQVQAVLIAGDIYDKPSPPAQAMSAFAEFVGQLCAADIRVYLISGNHDSPERVSYLAPLIRSCGVYVSDRFTGQLQTFQLEDEYGPLQLHLLPFVKPVLVRRFYREQELETYEDAVRAVLEHSQIDWNQRNVLLCHQFLTGANTCDSEELAIGGLDQIPVTVFDGFDYVALGHLHGPQQVGRPAVRYSGSPLKYSFSEVSHKKSVTLVELQQKGTLQIHTVPLQQVHEMREVRGTLEQLLAMPYSEDYIRATMTDETPRPDARALLLTVFPNLMRFAVENSRTSEEVSVRQLQAVEQKSPLELFRDFYAYQNNEQPPDAQRMQIIQTLLEELEAQG